MFARGDNKKDGHLTLERCRTSRQRCPNDPAPTLAPTTIHDTITRLATHTSDSTETTSEDDDKDTRGHQPSDTNPRD